MDVWFKHGAGLEVHKKISVAWVRWSSPAGVRRFSKQLASGLAGRPALHAWRTGLGVSHGATPAPTCGGRRCGVQSRGEYGKPVCNVLSAHFAVWLVNARDLPHVPGRPTDVGDAEWLCPLMRRGRLKRSDIPALAHRARRDLTHYRRRRVAARPSASQRLAKILEDCHIQWAAGVRHIPGVAARAMLEALMRGETATAAVAEWAKGSLRHTRPELAAARVGNIRDPQRFLWRKLWDHRAELNLRIAAIRDRSARAGRRAPGCQPGHPARDGGSDAG